MTYPHKICYPSLQNIRFHHLLKETVQHLAALPFKQRLLYKNLRLDLIFMIYYSLRISERTFMTYKPFVQAMVWNTINVFLYKIILQTHQACLFYVISKELFGVSGTLFSTMYLLINLTNFGFDYSLFAFYQYYISSKNNFQLLIRQFITRIIVLLITIACLLWLLKIFALVPQVSFITQHIPTGFLPLLVLIFISESLKKSCELFAHLSFLNRTITILEIITITCYIGIVWCSYFIRGYIDLYAIFIPMAITSWVELLILVKRLYSFYYGLPQVTPTTAHITPAPSSRTIVINQSLNYLNQITKALFSPNFIIIFLAYHLGMTRAGYIKLIIDCVILLYMLLNRAVGIPSGALLSKLSDVDQPNLPSFKTTFLKITNGYIQFLYGLAASLVFAIGPCLIKSSCLGSTISINILLFTFAGFLEYLLITYEKLYLTQGAASTLALVNSFSFIALILSLPLANLLPSPYLLLPFIIIRASSIILIAIVAYKIWGVSPSFKIHPKTVLIATIPAILLLALRQIL